MFNLKTLGLAAVLTASAGFASAATTIYDETGSNPTLRPAGVSAQSLGDFGGSSGTNVPTIGITGDTTIFGFVRHVADDDDQFDDPFTLDFGPSSFLAVFTFKNLKDASGLDFDLDFGDSTESFSVDGGEGGTFSLGVLTGSVDFNVNPIEGDIESEETMNYVLELSQVPVPAGGLLLLGGLGALAFARRKKA